MSPPLNQPRLFSDVPSSYVQGEPPAAMVMSKVPTPGAAVG